MRVQKDRFHVARAADRIHLHHVAGVQVRHLIAARVHEDAVGGVDDKQSVDGGIVEGDLRAIEMDRIPLDGFRGGEGVCLMRRPQHGQGIGGCPGGEGEEKRQEQRRQPCSDPPCGDTPRRRGRERVTRALGISHGPDCIHPAFLVARSWRAPLLRELSARVGVSISQGRSVRMPRRSHDLPGYRGNSPHGGFVGDTNRSFWSYPAAG